jgi:hypothetical protein
MSSDENWDEEPEESGSTRSDDSDDNELEGFSIKGEDDELGDEEVEKDSENDSDDDEEDF